MNKMNHHSLSAQVKFEYDHQNLVWIYLNIHINANINVDIYTYSKSKFLKTPNPFSLRFHRTERINQFLRISQNIP